MGELRAFYRIPAVWVGHLLGIAIVVLYVCGGLSLQVLEGAMSLSSGVPALRSYVQNSSFPALTAAYFVTMTIWGVFVFISLLKVPQLLAPRADKVMAKLGNVSILHPLLVGCLCFPGAAAVLLLPVGKPWHLLPIDRSEFALAVLGPLFAWLPSIMAAIGVGCWQIWKARTFLDVR